MLDDGSTITLISERVVNRLQLTGPPTKLKLATVEGKHGVRITRSVGIILEKDDRTKSMPLNAIILPNLLGTMPAVHWADWVDGGEHLRGSCFRYPRMVTELTC